MNKYIILPIAFLVALSGCTKTVSTTSPLDELRVITAKSDIPECRDWYRVNCQLSPDNLELMSQTDIDVNAWKTTWVELSSGDNAIRLATTPLLSAALRNDVDSAKRLLAMGANPNRTHSKYKMSLLELASAFGNPYSVEILLKAGADVHLGTPLVTAATNVEHGAEIIKILAEAGADPNVLDTQPHRPGIIRKLATSACDQTEFRHIFGLYESQDDNEIVPDDTESDDSKSDTNHLQVHPLDAAITIDNMNALLDIGAAPRLANYPYIVVLYRNKGWQDLFKRLLNAGFDVNKHKKADGSTMLMQLVSPAYYLSAGSKEDVLFLLNAGADVNAKDNEKRTALHHINSRWIPSDPDDERANAKNEITKMLIERGADVNAVDANGNTPICSAIDYEDCRTFSLLVAAGADLKKCNPPDEDAHGVMELAVKCGADDVKSAIAAGFAVNTDDDVYPLCYAMVNERLQSMRALLDAGAVFRDTTRCRKSIFADFLLSKKIHKEGINRDDIHRLAQAGMDVNAKTPGTLYTPLMVAARNNRAEVFFALLDEGANVNDVDANDVSVLHFAAFGGNVDIVKSLLKKKANVKAREKNQQRTPLMLSTTPEVAAALIEAGSDVNAVNIHNENALLYAIKKNGLEETALTMIKYGSKVNVQNNDGTTPLIAAASKPSNVTNNKLLDVLIQAEANVNATDKHGFTPLMAAAKSKNDYAVRALLDHGADINAASENGMTPLLYSLETSSAEETKDANLIADILLSRGAKLVSNNDQSVLNLAIRAGSVRVVEKYIKETGNLKIPKCLDTTLQNKAKSFDLKIPDCSETALQIAAKSLLDAAEEYEETLMLLRRFESGDDTDLELEFISRKKNMTHEDLINQYKNKIEIIKESISNYQRICDLLINAGEDVKALNDADVFLGNAVINPYLTSLLLKAGTDPNSDFYPPLRRAIEARNPESMQILIDAGAKMTDPFMLAGVNLRHGNAETLQILIDNGLDVKTVYHGYEEDNSDIEGATLLMAAAKFDLNVFPEAEVTNFKQMINVLIKAGLSIDAQDPKGWTALFYAVDEYNLIYLQLLLDAGADVSIKDAKGQTALDFAIDRDWKDGIELLKK